MFSLLAEDPRLVTRIHDAGRASASRSRAEAYELGRPGYPASRARAARAVARPHRPRPGRGDRQAHAPARCERRERDRRRARGRDARGAAGLGRGARRDGRVDPARGRLGGPRDRGAGLPLVRRRRRAGRDPPRAAARRAARAGLEPARGGRAGQCGARRARGALPARTPTHRDEAWRAAFERTTLVRAARGARLRQRAGAGRGRPGGAHLLDQLHRVAARSASVRGCSRAPASSSPRAAVTMPYRTEVQVCERLDERGD